MAGHPAFCSWSGGKDSCLALHHALRSGARPVRLFTMMAEDGSFSRSHGLSREVLQEQARHLGLPITFRSARWDDYEATFLRTLHQFRAEGITTGVFGDIDVAPNRDWGVNLCRAAGMTAVHPLWGRSRDDLLDRFLTLGFKAIVVVVDRRRLDPRFLGKPIDRATVAELRLTGIDASGELGEYHTLVTGGPLFSEDLRLTVGTRTDLAEHSMIEIIAG